MPSDPQRPKRLKWKRGLAFLLAGGLVVLYWNSDLILFPRSQTATVLLLDDCDDDFRTGPFKDALIAFPPGRASLRITSDLNICQTIGGGRSLAVSPDGRMLLVCENVAHHLSAFDLGTGRRVWRVDGEYTAVTAAPDGLIYAIISNGTIYGDRTVVIDRDGRIVKSGSPAGFDMVLDTNRNALWLVGKFIKKCDLNLDPLLELAPIKWCAAAVDLDADGSIWVAERDHPDVKQSTNRLFRVSADGQIQRSIPLPFSPFCLRIDRADHSLWVTGVGTREPVSKAMLAAVEQRVGTLPLGKWLREWLTARRYWHQTTKYDPEGKLLCDVGEGGHSLDIQQSDGSVWLAAKDKIYRFSREGKKIAKLTGMSAGQKYVVVVPEAGGRTNPPGIARE
jgi:sugar lactone lactonase YvrE